MATGAKPLVWMGSSLDDLRGMPREVRVFMGHALHVAQVGGKHEAAKPLKGFGSAGVVEAVQNYEGNSYRAVYTVRLEGRVYALHVFEKKSKQGIATPKPDIDLIRRRLKRAETMHAEWLEEKRNDDA
jgi:phage-related protein